MLGIKKLLKFPFENQIHLLHKNIDYIKIKSCAHIYTKKSTNILHQNNDLPESEYNVHVTFLM